MVPGRTHDGAMISMQHQQQQQQTVLNNVTGGPEQPQEEVQLTELLPVKQSRIRENVFKDADATDALRALRSLSGDCGDGESFDSLREFNFCKNVEQSERQSGKHRRVESRQRKRPAEETKSRTKDVDLEEGNSDVGVEKKVRNGRKITRPKTLKRKLMRSSRKKDDENNYGTNEKSIEKDIDGCDEEDDDEQLYLDLEKKDCFKDEVYVYRQEPLDSYSSSESEESAVTSDKDRRDNYLTTDGELFDKKRNFAGKSFNINNEKEKSKAGDLIEKENPEKELRLRIDAIIQANYLLEQENNNVVGSDKISEHIGTSSATASINAENSDDSLCNSAEPQKKTKRKRTDQARQSKDQQNPQKKYCCVVCDARFKGSGGLRNHYKVVHGAGPVFKCDECGKEFPLKERLKLHVRTHTGFKPYKCPECDKSFARGGQLVQHRRTHSQVRPFHCKLCSNTFTCAANLSLHLKRHNGQKDHKCDLCGRAFVRRDALKKHLECLHRDVKSFLCAICNKTFKGHLPQHMRTHARDRPHGCATCGQRFAQKSQLTVHQRTHSGQRPFRCLVCWQAFAHSTALKLHTRRHTGERPFKCSECNAGFTQLPHWKKHMKCIHGRNDPYGCKRCKSFFRIKSDLESHEKTCHPEMEDDDDSVSGRPAGGSEIVEKNSVTAKYKLMTVEKMRLLLAVLLKRISKQERLDELGFGKRLIDDVLQDSLVSAGKEPVTGNGLSELEALTKNLEIFLEWTVPKEHWENFRKMKKSPEDILETLTAT
ncbi:zinc finger protein 37-like [Monomorium pharaonis]|uniref:zinc finger protein 37-like n=1 Tax=Monomorium pharaonis TaxID=307658 RepID=UPI00063FC781|nr:zinc finger protein 37-like [Monomorium pharaonis]XP_036145653.1 zinc finger protein 37-like [Monomorium pharaonis]